MLAELKCFVCEGSINPNHSHSVSLDGKPICAGCESDIVREREKNRILMEQMGWAAQLSVEAAKLGTSIMCGSLEEVEKHLAEIDHLNLVLQRTILGGDVR